MRIHKSVTQLFLVLFSTILLRNVYCQLGREVEIPKNEDITTTGKPISNNENKDAGGNNNDLVIRSRLTCPEIIARGTNNKCLLKLCLKLSRGAKGTKSNILPIFIIFCVLLIILLILSTIGFIRKNQRITESPLEKDSRVQTTNTSLEPISPVSLPESAVKSKNKSQPPTTSSDPVVREKVRSLEQKRIIEHKEDIKSSKFRKKGSIFIPNDVTGVNLKLKRVPSSGKVLPKVFYDEKQNEQYDVGTYIDDVEMAPDTEASNIRQSSSIGAKASLSPKTDRTLEEPSAPLAPVPIKKKKSKDKKSASKSK